MLTTKRRTTAAQKEKKRVVKNNLDRCPKSDLIGLTTSLSV
jgi:hypothetical protein